MINWKFKQHMAMAKEHALMENSQYRGQQIIKETHTKFKHGKPGGAEVIFWTPSDKKNYETLEQLLQSIDNRIDQSIQLLSDQETKEWGDR